jgi:hypothetical protein
MYGFLICMRDLPVIRPDTRKTQVRGPEASRHARKLPLPVSFRFVTSITVPPRPPTDSAPPPSASGNDGQPELGQFADVLGADGAGGGFDVVVAADTVTFAVADIVSSASLVAVIVSVPAFAGAV